MCRHSRRGNRPPRPQAAYMAPMRYEIRSRRGPPPPSPARRLLLSPVPQRKRALDKIKAAHVARRSPSAKVRIIGRPIGKTSFLCVFVEMQLDVKTLQSPPNRSFLLLNLAKPRQARP